MFALFLADRAMLCGRDGVNCRLGSVLEEENQ